MCNPDVLTVGISRY